MEKKKNTIKEIHVVYHMKKYTYIICPISIKCEKNRDFSRENKNDE